MYNPPDTEGFDGLPFFYNTTAGGIEDARTGQIFTGHVFMVAILYDPSIDKYIVLAWGLSGVDTEAAGFSLRITGGRHRTARQLSWLGTTRRAYPCQAH